MAEYPITRTVQIQYITTDFKIHKKFIDESFLKEISNYESWCLFQNDIQQTGWAYLEVHSNKLSSDTNQAYYSGLIEGYVTAELIYAQWENKLANYGETEYCNRLTKFIKTNFDFLKKQIKQNREKDPYWHHVALVIEQLKGVHDGYALKTKNRVPLGPEIDIEPLSEVFLLNLIPDLDVLEEVLQYKFIDRLIGEGSCSAIVKPLSDGSDILVSHSMWSSYSSMLRIIKKYSFGYHNTLIDKSIIPGHTISFSSYPGAILSLDDFYITSSKLVVQETTFEILANDSLWELVNPENSVPEFIRVIVANRLSSSGQQWSRIFEKYNSGTYNSQFMIIDYKEFTPRTKVSELKDNLLWITEQLPGLIKSADVTQVLREKGYWSSYNIPYFPEIYQLSGHPDLVEMYGHYFSYDHSPRAQIFRRDHSKVTDMKSLYKLMRYNDFKNDPLSKYPKCTPEYSADLAIAARNDLNDPNGNYSVPVLGFRGRGAIDAKLTNAAMIETFEMIAVSGPSCESQPPFIWSETKVKGLKHKGHPDVWTFEPITMKWLNLN